MSKSTEVKSKKFAQELPCKLTGIEKANKKDRMLELAAQRHEIEGRKKLANENFNKSLQAIAIEYDKLVGVLVAGEEPRMVECEPRPDFERNRIVIVRLDTHEQVGEERAMTAKEHDDFAQVEIPISNGADASPTEARP